MKKFQVSIRSLWAVLVFGALWCTPVFSEKVDYFADNGFDNPLSTLQHPCAEYYNGKTYIAYQGPHEDPYIAAYDHSKRTWEGPVRAAVSEMWKNAKPPAEGVVDNHGRPALMVDGEGYIHLVFGGHGGDSVLGENRLGTHGKGKQIHIVSSRPEDISSFKTLDNISPFGTYSQFVKMEDGDIYLFYRHGSHRSDWVYQKTSDNGRTFAPPVSILKHKVRQENPDFHDAWYAWFGKGKGDSVVVTYIYHRCSISQHEKARFNAYFMKLDCSTGTLTNAAGEVLTVPVTKEHADEKTRVFESQDERCDRGSVTVDRDGQPHFHFRYGSGHLLYTRWLGDAWQKPVEITDTLKHQDGDLLVDSPLSARILITGNRPKGGAEVAWWKTADGGLTWSREELAVESSDVSYVMSALVHNFHPDAQVVLNEKDPQSQHQYRRMYLWGKGGLVQRTNAPK